MSRWTWLWFATSGLALLLALQVVITFNDLTCWKLSLLATEYGHRFALPVLFLAWRHWHSGSAERRILAWCNAVAALVLLYPLVPAINRARHLPSELQASWGGPLPRDESPLQPVSLWLGTWQRTLPTEKLEYVRDDSGARSLLLFRARSPKPAPCLMVIHAGSWENERENEFPDWSTHWAMRGCAVAVLQYRLAPKYVWPAQRDDVQMALAYLKENAGKLGLDPARFILLGRSAGGQIALASAYELKDPAVRGCISLYGPADLDFAWRFGKDTDVLDTFRLLRSYMGGGPVQSAATFRSGSPYLSVDGSACPTLLLHGSRDILVWNLQSRRMAARLQTLGVPHYLLELPLDVHGFDWAYDGPGGQLARYAIDQFMDTVFAKP